MQTNQYKNHERGFSIFELIVAMTLFLIVTAAVFSLLKSSFINSHATLEMTDGRQSLRTGQEYINRDLENVGDGLNSINNIRVPQNFVTRYLTGSPIVDPATPGIINLGLMTSDNNVPVNTIVSDTAPVRTVRSTPLLTDRISILQMELPEVFTPISLPATAIDPNTGNASVSPADINRFSVGEIYFITSAVGAIFVTVTNRGGIGTANPFLVFGPGDAFGLNSVGPNSQLDVVTAGQTLPTSICRMKIIHYYINDAGLLMRRVFGVRNAGFSESVIAEHAISLQFRYFLNLRDAKDNVVQPEAQLTTSQQQVETREVETTLAVETVHSLQDGQRQQISMTTSTSIRNMQFRQSLQPKAGG